MLKKIIVVAAVVMMASTAFGAWSRVLPPMDPNNIRNDQTVDWEQDGNLYQRKAEAWNWPATYDFVPMCEMRVQMDVGFWIRLEGCRDTILKLQQTYINEYNGSAKCKARTNVATEWKAEFFKYDNINLGSSNNAKKGTATVTPSTFDSTAGADKELTIALRLWDVDLANMPAGQKCLEIGKVTISVRPSVRPNLFMDGCSQKYPVYAPTK